MLNIIKVLQSFLYAVVIFGAPLFFLTDFTKNPYDIQVFILNFACGLLILLCVTKTFISGKISLRLSWPDVFFVGFLCMALVSISYNYFHTPHPDALLGEALRRGSILITNGFVAYVLARGAMYGKENDKLLLLFPLWFLMWALYPTFKMQGLFDIYAILMWCGILFLCAKYLKGLTVRGFLNIFCAAAFAAAFYGICQYFGGDIFWQVNISENFGARFVSTFGNPNYLSSYIIMALPIAVVFYLEAKKIYLKSYYFALCICLSAYLAVGFTRSAWLGAAIVGIIFILSIPFWRTVLKQKAAALFLLCGMLGIFFLWPAQGGTYKSAAVVRAAQSMPFADAKQISLADKDISQSYHQRLMMWHCAVEMAKQSPLLGKGWGSYQLHYGPCQGQLLKKYPNLKPLMTQANGAHNIILEVLAQSGIIGLTFFALFILSLFGCGIAKIIKAPEDKKLLSLAILCAIAAMLVDNMFNITLFVNITAFMFFWLASTLSSYDGAYKERPLAPAISLFIFAGVFTCVMVLFYLQYNMLKAATLDHKANKALAQRDYGTAANLADKALKLYPYNADTYDIFINSLVRKREYKAAINAANRALIYYPNYYEFYFRRGILNYAVGSEFAAIRDFRDTLALYPNYGPALAGMAEFFTTNPQKATDADLAIILSAGQDMPYKLNFRFAAAKIYIERGNTYAARDIASGLLDADTLNDEYYELLNNLNQELGLRHDDIITKGDKLREARNIIIFTKPIPLAKVQRLTDMYPGDVSAIIVLGEYYFASKMPQKAVESMLNFYKDNKYNFNLNFALSSSYSAMGDMHNAALHLNNILEVDPFNEIAVKRREKLKI